MYRTSKHPTLPKILTATIPATQLAQEYREMRKRVDLGDRDAEWVGGTPTQCQDYLDRGALNQVKRARDFADRVSRTVNIETPRKQKRNVYAGGRVRVAAYLAGSAKCYRRRVKVRDAAAPVRVFIDIGCSGGIEAKDVEKRGLALLAFAHCLSKQRPVEVIAFLYFRISKQDVLVKIPLGLKPVNWALAGAVVGHPSFMRDFAFRITRDIANKPRGGCVNWGASYQGNMVAREVLSAEPNDIVIGRGYYTDAVLRQDPVKWVGAELDRVLNREAK